MGMLEIQTEKIPPALPPIGLVFKLNPLPPTATPFLVPVINRPDFDIAKNLTPGIIQYADGNLGVTENVFGGIMNKTSKIYDESEFGVDGEQFTETAVPDDAGLKSFEKMAFQSMMESQKPTLELIQILIEMLAIVEDAIARLLATSIKIPIIKVWVGIPSKNPVYTIGSLNYDGEDEDAKNAKYIRNENRKAINYTTDSFPETANIYGGIPEGTTFDILDYEDPQTAYYIGYFDEDGQKHVPPKWVENSKKWFGDIWAIPVEEPFYQQPENLSNDQEIGVRQLLVRYKQNLSLLENEKAKLEKQFTSSENFSNAGVKMALGELDEVIESVNEGVIQTVYSEWFSKNATTQIKNMYKEPFVSTTEPVLDSKGEPIDPFVSMPKIAVRPGIEMEIPVVESENQLIRERRKVGKKRRKVIVGLRTTEGKNGEVIIEAEEPEDTDILYFQHQKPDTTEQSEIKAYKIPDEVKNFYLEHNFEIILIFEIRKVSTGEIIGTEEEIYPQRIDFERDYQLRLVRVINRPLTANPFEGKTFGTATDAKNYLSSYNLVDATSQITGTAFYVDNPEENDIRIPPAYNNTDGIESNHYADILNPDDGMFEGQIAHGIDPRFNSFNVVTKTVNTVTTYTIQQTKYHVFWLVEAIKINEDGFIYVNGKYYDTRSGADDDRDTRATANEEVRQKEWYGLLDNFTVIAIIAGKLVPIIAQKFIPLLVKVIQILTDPRKLADLVFLIITEKLSKFFGMFNTKFDDRADKDKAQQSGNEVEGYASKYNYTKGKNPDTVEIDPETGDVTTTTDDTVQEPKNVTDGKAEIEIFGFYIGIASKDGNVELYYTKEEMEKENGDLPDQKVLSFILDIIKMPFDIIKKIIDFLLEWVKKLVNPLTMLQAVIDLLTFKWLLDILKGKNLKSLLGFPDSDGLDNYEDTLNSMAKDKMNEDIVRSLQGDPIFGEFVEVLVYHVFRDGRFIREETEERRIDDLTVKSFFPPPGVNITDEIRAMSLRTNNANKDGLNNPPQPFPLSCGIRNIPINTYFPIPLLSQSPNYNLCDLIQVYLKPMELIKALLKILESFIQSLIALPFAAFGLAPTIPIPQLDFVSDLQSKIDQLRESLTPNIVPTIA